VDYMAAHVIKTEEDLALAEAMLGCQHDVPLNLL